MASRDDARERYRRCWERCRTSTETFVVWCHRYGPAVHAYLVCRAGRQAADDLFGEESLRAFSARDSYDVLLGGPLPWLYGIVATSFVLTGATAACSGASVVGSDNSARTPMTVSMLRRS